MTLLKSPSPCNLDPSWDWSLSKRASKGFHELKWELEKETTFISGHIFTSYSKMKKFTLIVSLIAFMETCVSRYQLTLVSRTRCPVAHLSLELFSSRKHGLSSRCKHRYRCGYRTISKHIGQEYDNETEKNVYVGPRKLGGHMKYTYIFNSVLRGYQIIAVQ